MAFRGYLLKIGSGNSPDAWENSYYLGSKSPSLSVDGDTELDGSQYRCVATDSHGNTLTSNAVTMTVAPIVITQQPTDWYGLYSTTMYYHVEAIGVGLTYQWQLSSNGSSWSNTTLTGYNTDTLNGNGKTSYKNRLYRCVITDAYGNSVASQGGRMCGDYVAIKTHPQDTSALYGETVELSVYAVCATGKTPITYQWQYRASELDEWANSTYEGNQTPTLTFTASAEQNGMQFQCIATDNANRSTTSLTATVTTASAFITQQPVTTPAKEGETISFSVVVESAEGITPTYKWKTKMPEDENWTDSTFTGNATPIVYVPGELSRNGRQYKCEITAGDNSYETDIVSIVVVPTGTISFFRQPENTTTSIVDPAVFTVEAIGDDLTYQWQTNSVPKIEFPMKYISVESYKITPNQRMEQKATRNARGYLVRVTLEHMPVKIEFETLDGLTSENVGEISARLSFRYDNPTERKITIEYYDPETDMYKTAQCYMPDVEYLIHHIDKENNLVIYNKLRYAFIEY